MRIEDGKGDGFFAGVDGDNRLLVDSQATQLMEYMALNKLAYMVYTTVLTLTAATESAILYLKNNDALHTMLIKKASVSLGKSNAAGTCIVKRVHAPTAGTIISDASAATVTNKDAAVSQPPSLVAYKGGEGKTATGGSEISARLSSDGTICDIAEDIILSIGNSLVLLVTPPTGNTSMKVAISVHLAMMPLQ